MERRSLFTFTFFDFFLLSLASFRLTRLFVFDKITESFRNLFMDEVIEQDENGVEEIYYVPTRKSKWRNFLGELLSCYWCTGIWVSTGLFLIIIFVEHFLAYILVWILAIAGFAAIIETLVQKWLD